MKRFKGFIKKVSALVLAALMIFGAVPLDGVPGLLTAHAYAEEASSVEGDIQVKSYDVFYAQNLLGYYDVNGISKKVFDYYTSDDVYLQTTNMLRLIKENEALSAELDVWKAYLAAGSVSSAVQQKMNQQDYCETLILQLLSISLKDSMITEILKNDALNNYLSFSKDLLKNVGVATTAELVQKYGDSLMKDTGESYNYIYNALRESVDKYFDVGKDTKYVETLDEIISYSSDILEVLDKIAVYKELTELDQYTKAWLQNMYDLCEKGTPMSDALYSLLQASIDLSGATFVSYGSAIKTARDWVVKESIDWGISSLCKSHPVVSAIVSGFKLGKTICDIFFNSSDVCEQLYVMEQFDNVQKLARKTLDYSKIKFQQDQNGDTAKMFAKSTDMYFITISTLDCNCILEYLETLKKAGFNEADYNDCKSEAENLRDIREKNYSDMRLAVKATLKVEFPLSFQSIFSKDCFEYTVSNNAATITGLKDKSFEQIRIPESIGGYAVKTIGANAFKNCSSITDVIFTDNVTSIGNEAFKDCRNLTSVTIGNGVTSIDSYTFWSCSNLTSVTIGKSVTNIGGDAFYGCIGLRSIDVDANNQNYSSKDGVLFNKDQTLLIKYPIGNQRKEYTIPNSVASIGGDAFYGCNSLTNVTIPDSVTNIGSFSFNNCRNLTSVTIGNGVANIDNYAFSGCNSLTSVTIPDSVTSIGIFAFSGCSGLTSVTIGNSVTGISYHAFYHCSSLTNVILGSSVNSIDGYAFCGCSSLTSVIIPESVTSIDTGAFCNCTSLTSVDIPDSVTSISKDAFSDCVSLTSVTIGNGMTNIGDLVFYCCSGLTSVTISDSVTSIDRRAFEGCDALGDVYYTGTEEQWKKISIAEGSASYQVLANATVHYNWHEHITKPVHIEPTCSVRGREYEECVICAQPIGEITYIPTIAHTEVIDEAIPSTCTKKGKTKGSHCSVCGEVLAAQQAAPLAEHKWELVGQKTVGNKNYKVYECSVCSNKKDVEDFICGDVTGDGKVNNLDRVVLERYLSNWDGYENKINLSAADVNGDGKVNNLDRVILTRHLTNWDGYETLPLN